ncbi:MAG: hypothetical protein M5U09_11075 [Gammaproteobacteria bacterium]|nr:hypothetical protein [Gammaproteobacteria bacterium]
MTGVSNNLLGTARHTLRVRSQCPVLGPDIAIERGSVTVIMGPSGCGKSTQVLGLVSQLPG